MNVVTSNVKMNGSLDALKLIKVIRAPYTPIHRSLGLERTAPKAVLVVLETFREVDLTL